MCWLIETLGWRTTGTLAAVPFAIGYLAYRLATDRFFRLGVKAFFGL